MHNKRRYHFEGFLLFISIVLVWAGPVHGSAGEGSKGDPASIKRRILEKMPVLQVPFIANEGQLDEEVSFYARTFGGTIYVTRRGEMVYSLITKEKGPASGNKIAACVLKERLLGTKEIRPEGVERAGTKVNYFIGNKKDRWRTNISSFHNVDLGEVYDRIGLSLRAHGNNVEKIFTIHPTGNVEDIRLIIEGAMSMAVGADGRLDVDTGSGTVSFTPPVAFQEIGGKKKDVRVVYQINDRTYGFRVGEYDHDYPLIIDPSLTYSTYLGGSDDDAAVGIAVDGSGNAYIAGSAPPTGLPSKTLSVSEIIVGGTNAYVAMLNSSGSALTYYTYLGGSGDDEALGIAVDGSGNAYITGSTASADFPTTTSAKQETYGGGDTDAFVAKIKPDGRDSLLYSTYLGGSDEDIGSGIAVDSGENAYITGYTKSTNFPTTAGIVQDFHGGGTDAFVTKVTSDGSDFWYSTYLGGSGEDVSLGIALDSDKNAYITGYTTSANFPTQNPFQSNKAGLLTNAFVTKINSSGSTLSYSTYLGGGLDSGSRIAVDSSGNAYVTGATSSDDFPTQNPIYSTRAGGIDIFVTKFKPLGNELSYSTFLGGSDTDACLGIAVDGFGNAYVTGSTSSSDFPTKNPYQIGYAEGATDAFLTKINASGSILSFSTYLGGSGDDAGGGIAVDGSGDAYVTGSTSSSDFPTTTGAEQEDLAGGKDIFVSKLVVNDPPEAIDGTLATDEDTASSGALSASDANDDSLIYSIVSDVSNGTLLLDTATGAYTYTPDDNFNGNDTFTFKVNDGYADSDTATVTVTIFAINDAPVATSQSVSTGEDTPASVTLSATDIDGDTLTYSVVKDPSHGAVSGTAPNLTYTPAASYHGSDSFDFKANDGQVDSDPVTVSITINGLPDKPTATGPLAEITVAPGDVELQSSAYGDPEDDSHARTHWRVRRIDQIAFFYEVSSESDLTEHTVAGLEAGMKYAWQVGYEDSFGNISWSEEYVFKVGTSVEETIPKIEPGTEVDDFRMVSFVHWPDNPTATIVFGVTYDTDFFKIGTYDPTQGSYVEYGTDLKIKPGRAYWVLARNGVEITYDGVPVSTENDVEVELLYDSDTQDGWNMIGCPNAKNYFWDDVQVVAYDADGQIVSGPTTISNLTDPNDSIDIRIWKWTNDAADPYISYKPGDAFLMVAYRGYWVKAKKANVHLRFRRVVQQARLFNPRKRNDDFVDMDERRRRITDSGDSPPMPIGDFSGSSGGMSCFIATAAYGSPMERHVKILRNFRDRYLLSWTAGTWVVNTYYRFSPPLADFIAIHDSLRIMARLILFPVVGICWVVLTIGSAPALAFIFLFGAGLVGLTGLKKRFKKI